MVRSNYKKVNLGEDRPGGGGRSGGGREAGALS